jgi:hypothetical protein
MTNKFITAMRANKNWLTTSLFVIAVIIITITLFHGGVGALNPTKLFFFTGLIAFFFAFLNTWGNRSRKYYAILMGISVLLFFLLFKFGIGTLVDIQSKYQIQGHWAEDIAWSAGFILVAVFMAGLVGIFVCISRWR